MKWQLRVVNVTQRKGTPLGRVEKRRLGACAALVGESVVVSRSIIGATFKRSLNFKYDLNGLCHESYQKMRLPRIQIDFFENVFFWLF